MGSPLRAIVFVLIGLAAAWGLAEDIRSGTSSDGTWTFSSAGNPIGYASFLIMKLGFVAFGVAELLYCLNFISDPFVAIMSFIRGVGYRRTG